MVGWILEECLAGPAHELVGVFVVRQEFTASFFSVRGTLFL